ncbi:MAG: ATP-binding protein [Chloroflexota bacterium]
MGLRSGLAVPHIAWLYLSDWSLTCVMGSLTMMIQFGYHYPSLHPEQRVESRIALWLSVGATLLYLGAAFLEINGVSIFSLSPFTLYQILMPGQALWLFTLYLRKLFYYARLAQLTTWREIWLVPQDAQVRAFRMLLLIHCSPLLGVGHTIWQQLTSPTNLLAEVVGGLLVAFILFLGMFSIMTYLVEPTNLLYKLTSMAFLLLFFLSNSIAYLILPFLRTGYEPIPPVQSGEQIRFERQGETAYRVRFISQSDSSEFQAPHANLGERMAIENDQAVEIPLNFPLKVFDQTWETVVASDDGYIMEKKPYYEGGDPIQRAAGFPIIAPLVVDFAPTSNSGLYVAHSDEATTITWHEMITSYDEDAGQERNRQERNRQEGNDQVNNRGNQQNSQQNRMNTISLTLWANGDIDFRYPQLNLQRTLESDLSLQSFLIGISPKKTSPIRLLDLTPDLDMTVDESSALLHQFNTEALAYTHQRLYPFAILNILAGLLIMLGFPLFLRHTLVRPLSRLMHNVERVDAGDLSITTPVQSHDEIGFLTDAFNRMVSSIRQSNNELQALNVSLEERIEERTAQLASANQAKSRFLANMSHELRTPLNVILGHTQILQRAEQSSEPWLDHPRPLARSVLGEGAKSSTNLSQTLSETGSKTAQQSRNQTDLVEPHRTYTEIYREGAEIHRDSREQRTSSREAQVIPDGSTEGKTGKEPLSRRSDRLEMIQQSGEHLLGLLNDILDLSRIEAGKESVQAKAIMLTPFIQQIVRMIDLQAREKGLMLDYEHTDRLPEAVRLDDRLVRQVLINLLHNAIKFTDQGSVTLIVKEVSIEEGGRVDGENWTEEMKMIRFTVRDTGKGILPAELDKIFDAFEQGENQDRAIQGVGLGLAISQRLLNLMQSRLHVTSAVGEGTTFWFDLPVVAFASSSDRIVQQPHIAAESHEGYLLGYNNPRQTALIVDDNSENRAILADMLSLIGFKVIQAVNGRNGVDTAQERQPNLILMDLVMPEMDGLSAVQLMRTMPALQKTPIFAISATVFESDVAECLAAGYDAFLPKPVNLRQLHQLLETYLPLDWVRESASRASKAEIAIDGNARHEQLVNGSSLHSPPADDLEQLMQMTLIGNIRALRNKTAELRQQDAAYQKFVDELEKRLSGYQMNDVKELLETYLSYRKG